MADGPMTDAQKLEALRKIITDAGFDITAVQPAEIAPLAPHDPIQGKAETPPDQDAPPAPSQVQDQPQDLPTPTARGLYAALAAASNAYDSEHAHDEDDLILDATAAGLILGSFAKRNSSPTAVLAMAVATAFGVMNGSIPS